MSDVYSNAMMPTQMVKKIYKTNEAGKKLLKTDMKKIWLSACAYDQILKLSRTMADLYCTEEIQIEHITEAIQYRSLDREGWSEIEVRSRKLNSMD